MHLLWVQLCICISKFVSPFSFCRSVILFQFHLMAPFRPDFIEQPPLFEVLTGERIDWRSRSWRLFCIADCGRESADPTPLVGSIISIQYVCPENPCIGSKTVQISETVQNWCCDCR
jgi:hypothetical protein